MNRMAKTLRIVDGVLMLFNLVLFFLPVLCISQENYPEQSYSQFRFVKQLFEKEKGFSLSGEQEIGIIILIMLPLLLSLAMGIIGIVGSARQIISGIGSLAVAGLIIIFCWKIKLFWPERLNDAQDYQMDYGWYFFAVLAALLLIFGVLTIIFTPRLRKKESSDMVYKESQNIALAESKSLSSQESNMKQGSKIISPVIQKPRGVLVGLSGSYQGAEIPVAAGETLKLGRDNSNDLVFKDSTRVSRFHCTITWIAEEGRYQIVDQSSNGSFIDGREDCIPQNIAIFLEPGTILAIGSQENRFRLE